MCTVHLPVEADVCGRNIELIAMEGGRLGFASNNNSGIFLWSREVGPDGDAQWAQIRVIEREKLLPDGVSSVVVSSYVDGAEIIFTYTVGYRLFMVDLKSARITELGKEFGCQRVLPFTSFCTPAMRRICADEGCGAGVSDA
ncbi:hypothetical protein EJB05_14104, partial [Eragrostis curvula]